MKVTGVLNCSVFFFALWPFLYYHKETTFQINDEMMFDFMAPVGLYNRRSTDYAYLSHFKTNCIYFL